MPVARTNEKREQILASEEPPGREASVIPAAAKAVNTSTGRRPRRQWFPRRAHRTMLCGLVDLRAMNFPARRCTDFLVRTSIACTSM